MLDKAVEDGGFSFAIAAAQDVDFGAQFPDDVLVAAPKAGDFNALDFFG